MCFMAICELDEVNFNLNYEDLQEAIDELYGDLEKLGLKNVSLKKKIQSIKKELRNKQENFTKVEQEKISVAKENEVLKMKYD